MTETSSFDLNRPPRPRPDWDALPYGGDLFGELHLAESAPAPRSGQRPGLFPGLALCGVAAAAAAWLSDHYGFPIILLGLLVGLALNFISADPRTHPGLDFASRTCLRWGIVVLGFQVTFMPNRRIGGCSLPCPGCGDGSDPACRYRQREALWPIELCRALGRRGDGDLRGKRGAGALRCDRQGIGCRQAQFALTLSAFRWQAHLPCRSIRSLHPSWTLSDQQAGFLIGASIHDVAQAIGGGYAFSDAAGSQATIVKLTRVALLAPVVALVTPVLSGGRRRGPAGVEAAWPCPGSSSPSWGWCAQQPGRRLPAEVTKGLPHRIQGAAAAGGDRHRDAQPDGPAAADGLARDRAGAGRDTVEFSLCIGVCDDIILSEAAIAKQQPAD
jgi:hypothetical protein